jgi:hypothetical protein
MGNSESRGVTGHFYCVLSAEDKAASRVSYPDKHVGVGGTYYDEHAPGNDGDSNCGGYIYFVHSSMAALLFQRHSISDASCKVGGRKMLVLWRRAAS